MQTDWRLWALGSAACAALTTVLAKVGVTGVGSNFVTVIRTEVILVCSSVLMWTSGAARGWTALGGAPSSSSCFPAWSQVYIVACHFRTLQLGEASRDAPVDKLSVVFVMILAAAFLGEKLSWPQCLGGGFILAGVVLIAWKP